MRGLLRILLLDVIIFGTLSHSADTVIRKPEPYLVLPGPKAVRLSTSKEFAGAQRTALTPAKQGTDARSIAAYTPDEFAKLGISWETFLERAKAAADRRLSLMKAEVVKDSTGQASYAVYRGADTSIACLLVAPSLGKVFTNIFGRDIWIVTPDRNSLYIFPAKAEALAEFAGDLKERFDSGVQASSEEIFELKSDGSGLRAIGSLPRR